MFPIYRNQSIDLYCKSIDWFLYDEEHWSLMGLRIGKLSVKRVIFDHVFEWLAVKGHKYIQSNLRWIRFA